MQQQIKPINLVQRGSIRRPVTHYTDTRLSQAVNMDYMGNAHFEFGALPKSFRAIEAEVDALNMRVVPEIVHAKGMALRVVSLLSDDQWPEYLKMLLEVRTNTRTLEENSYFIPMFDAQTGRNKTDFWWDIENHVMWSFDKKFMSGLVGCLAASLNYMNEQRAKAHA